jgi:hypothetical protein
MWRNLTVNGGRVADPSLSSDTPERFPEILRQAWECSHAVAGSRWFPRDPGDIGEAVPCQRAAVLHLLWRGELKTDLSTPLSDRHQLLRPA